MHQAQELGVLVVGAADAVGEVGARETAAQDAGFVETQAVHDVVGDELRGRGREGQNGNAGELLAQLGDAQVGGPEVVAPLRDAVGLVDGEQLHVHAHDAQPERFRSQPLGSHVEELDVAVDAVVQGDVDLPGRESGVDGHGRDAPGPQAVDLVLHQGDERRDDDAETLAGERGNLVGERLAAARGHEREGVAARQHRPDDLGLHGAEFVEAPVAPQHVVYFLLAGLHTTKLRIKNEKRRIPAAARAYAPQATAPIPDSISLQETPSAYVLARGAATKH